MSTYKVEWLEKKEKLLEVKLRDTVTGIEADAVIWKTDKDGKEFPNYDTIINGGNVEGNLWTNPKNGSRTLYPPSPKKTGAKPNFEKAQEVKRENIQEAQTRKENSIELAGTARDATLMVTTFYKDKGLSETELADKWQKWRNYFKSNFGSADLPF